MKILAIVAHPDDETILCGGTLALLARAGAEVITHGSNGEYGHPAHILTHQTLRAAIPEGVVLYTFSPSFPEHPRPRLANADDAADLILDISPVFEQKVAAALCHRTQNALFVRRSSLRAGRPLSIPEVLMKVEGLHRVNGLLDDRLMDVLKSLRLKVAD